MKQMSIAGIFSEDAASLVRAREEAHRLHPTDIRAAGNQVEISVRDYLKLRLPTKYYVTHGHIIDAEGNTTPQLDVIISDFVNLPSLLRASDGTEYVPIESVYAVGEVKSTFYSSNKPIQNFSNSILSITQDLDYELIPNTAYEGIKSDTLMRDIAFPRPNKFLNQLFCFEIFIDSGDFNTEKAIKEIHGLQIDLLPNIIVILDAGVIVRASLQDQNFNINRYPDLPKSDNEEWYFAPIIGGGSEMLYANHLSFLYYSLLEHLTGSLLEPPSLTKYMKKTLQLSTSSLVKLVAI